MCINDLYSNNEFPFSHIFKAICNLYLAIEVENKYLSLFMSMSLLISRRDLLFDNLHCIGMYNVSFTVFTMKRNNNY